MSSGNYIKNVAIVGVSWPYFLATKTAELTIVTFRLPGTAAAQWLTSFSQQANTL